MVNINGTAVNHFVSDFLSAGAPDKIQPSIASSDQPVKFTAFFSTDSFANGIWTPDKIEKKRKRRSGPEYTPEDRCNSLFYKNYIQPAGEDVSTELGIWNELSEKGKRFRRRFRVPYGIFKEICISMVEEGYYLPGFCANGWPKVEVELLVLASLRYIASGCTFDMVEEFTELSRSIIKLPEVEEELRHVVGLYERIGLPGCVGSVDCVHLVWDKCPAAYLSQCKGKEKLPTLAFQAVVSHTQKLLALSHFFTGGTNDKSIARYDPAIQKIRGKSDTLAGLEWGAFSRDGVERRQKGGYYICDGLSLLAAVSGTVQDADRWE